MNKGISVVICSYNSEHRIKRVLDCLSAQQNCDEIAWEVIMVDNASTDNVIEVAEKSWNHPKVPLHIFHEQRQGQSYATRTGIEKAAYHIIVMIDDDNYVSPNYIYRANKIMEEHPEVGIAGGKGELGQAKVERTGDLPALGCRTRHRFVSRVLSPSICA